MLKKKKRRILLILFVLICNERASRILGSFQKGNKVQKKIQACPKHNRLRGQYVMTEKEDKKTYGLLSVKNQNHKETLFAVQNVQARNLQHYSFSSPGRSPRFPRDIGTTSAEPENPVETNPEPGPDWPSAFQTWGKAWDVHVYLFAVLYTLTAGTSAIGLTHDVLANHGIKGLKLTLYLTLLFIGCLRATIMFIDPYSSRGTLGLINTYIAWSLGFPCVLAALGLLLLVFVDVTKMNFAPPRFQKLSTALGVMVFNVFMVLATDLVFLLTRKGFVLLIICHVYFLLLGLILTAGFIRVGFQISSNSAADIYGDTGLARLRILSFISAALNLLFLGVQVYSVIQLDVLSDTPGAWLWYAVQTSLRALELSMCVVMLFIVFNNRVRSPRVRWKCFLPNRFRNAVSPLPQGFAMP